MPAVVPIHRLRGTVLGLVGVRTNPAQLVGAKGQNRSGLRVVTFDPFVPQTVLDQAGVERRGVRSIGANVGITFLIQHAALAGDAPFV